MTLLQNGLEQTVTVCARTAGFLLLSLLSSAARPFRLLKRRRFMAVPQVDAPEESDDEEVSHGLQLQSLWRIPTAAVS